LTTALSVFLRQLDREVKEHHNEFLQDAKSPKIAELLPNFPLKPSFVSSRTRPYLHQPRCPKAIMFLRKNHWLCLCLLLLKKETKRVFKTEQFSA